MLLLFYKLWVFVNIMSNFKQLNKLQCTTKKRNKRHLLQNMRLEKQKRVWNTEKRKITFKTLALILCMSRKIGKNLNPIWQNFMKKRRENRLPNQSWWFRSPDRRTGKKKRGPCEPQMSRNRTMWFGKCHQVSTHIRKALWMHPPQSPDRNLD